MYMSATHKKITEKELQIEVIKFLKGAQYTEVLKEYRNAYDAIKATLQAKYEVEDYYTSNVAIHSEKKMMIEKLNIFKLFFDDIKWEGAAQEHIKELISVQIDAVKSQLYNTVTNSFGMSKDVSVHTEDDLMQWRMLHYNEFNISIVSMMNPSKDEYSLPSDAKDIYEDPEEYFE